MGSRISTNKSKSSVNAKKQNKALKTSSKNSKPNKPAHKKTSQRNPNSIITILKERIWVTVVASILLVATFVGGIYMVVTLQGDKRVKWGPADTKPDAVASRVEKIMNRNEFEAMFPYRFGSAGWKSVMSTLGNYSKDAVEKMDEYYSYDNFIAAVKWLANSVYVLEYRFDKLADGTESIIPYCPRQSVINKTTLKETILNTEPDFNASWNANKGIKRVEIDYGTFLLEGSANDAKRELAGFLANCAHETGEKDWGVFDSINGGLFWNEEISHIGGYTDNYTDKANTSFPAKPGKSYHGRGPFQLSWNQNYGLLSAMLYDDINVLLDKPEKVSEDGRLGFVSAIWFWMTPQNPKASMHAIMAKTWTPERPQDNQYYKNGNTDLRGFGVTIVIINGGFEADKDESYAQVARRINFYKTFCDTFGAKISGEKLNTKGMQAWT